MHTSEKIGALRAAMKNEKLDAYIIPSSDPHQSEYVASHWKSRQWISGFTGSAGTVVVTGDHAGLWTDSRYFIQAESQLKDSGVTLHKLNIPHTPQHKDWLADNLPTGSTIGLDGKLFSVGQVRNLARHFHDKEIELRTDVDLIGEIWKERIALPEDKVFEHEAKYSGADRSEKLTMVREKMKNASHYLISTLDDIAWLFNLRGSDVECNPVFYAYAVVEKEVAWLFVDKNKLNESLIHRLNNDGVVIKPYGELESFLSSLPEGSKIQVDMASTSNQVYSSIDKKKVVEGKNLVAMLKAIKNPVEIEHIRKVMIKDGVALVKMFRWLEHTLQDRTVPETEVAEKLIDFRKAQDGYFGESFHAIVGYNGNGAIVHYHAEKETCAAIHQEGMLLIDSGGQYLDGTTDITRTIALSSPSTEQKRDFTLVLKGCIALTIAKFPHGTSGVQLDTLARMFLWQHHLNYGHGTGHGVGFFLNVHEPPQGFSPVANTPRANIAIVPGMVTSNEPGIYKTDKYGIRTENLVLCVKDGEETEFGEFYRFETLTLFPIDLQLIDKELMTKAERDWLNDYHAEVYEKLSPALDEEEKEWLKLKCRAI